MEILKPFPLFTEQQAREFTLIDQLVPGRVMGPDPLRQTRNNNIYWLTLDQMLKDRLWNLALDLQDQYAWTWFQEPVQVSRYGPGQYYDWHRDTYGTEARASTRVLTLTCSLVTAPGSGVDVEDQSFDLEPGWAVFFPSHSLHRARAPLTGLRWALTVWYMQPTRASC